MTRVSMASRGIWIFALTNALATPAYAQTESAPAVMEELVVTAQRREERLLDVPIAIEVLSGEELDRSTSQGVVDTLNLIPGVLISRSATGGQNTIRIRGVSAATVGYYIDAVPFGFIRSSAVPDVGEFDLNRVEVLKGPQGTLYGANSQAGVVRILTNDADLREFAVKARAGVSSTEEGGGNYRGDLAVNIPVIEDKLALRAVGGHQQWDGWIDSPVARNVNSSESDSLRLKLNAQPSENLQIKASYWLVRDTFDSNTGSNDEYFSRTAVDVPVTQDYDTYGLNVAYDFQAFTFTSATSYIDYKSRGIVDYAGTLGLPDAVLDTRDRAQTFSEEINLGSNATGPWKWNLGGIYRDNETTFSQVRRNAAGVPVFGYAAPNTWTDASRSFAAFGELTRVLADGLFEITGGVRYFRDEYEMDQTSRQNAVNTGLFVREDTFEKFSPRIALTWHPHADLMVYTSYSEGFRSGYSQTPVVLLGAPQLQSVRPDNLKNLELGSKGALLDGLIAFEAAVYYIKYDSIHQLLGINVGTAAQPQNVLATVNGPSASGFGTDLGVTIKPAQGLTFGAGASLSRLTFDSSVISNGNVLYPEGERIGDQPESSFTGWADYQFPLGRSDFDGKLSIAAHQISKKGRRNLTGTGTSVLTYTDEFVSVDASFSIATARWGVMLYVDNVTDYNKLRDGSPFGVPEWDYRVRPRTLGVQINTDF